ncbi:MAG: hypothetical protein CVV64_01045 [Candidatus Wallbacteria bacterium HGW-Wallbacteria-1]|uniref:Uncharacterized protein n=1 Tax=Candidatus Wallbacteria bacterium HGW-Wallbacteria-1 TaxID=2013854 RepID=A0A2N1PUQ3_9BACT|nr:MAG: hypothetical protein CVV64_01045 [Candidatus Wallbacteria bacterium HGW-Wallbacteria-1]
MFTVIRRSGLRSSRAMALSLPPVLIALFLFSFASTAICQDSEPKKVPGEVQINFYRLLEVLPELQQFRCLDTSTKEKILFSSHSFMGSMYVVKVARDRVVFDSFDWMVPTAESSQVMEDAQVYSEAGRELEEELGMSLDDIAAPGEEDFPVSDSPDEEYSDEPEYGGGPTGQPGNMGGSGPNGMPNGGAGMNQGMNQGMNPGMGPGGNPGMRPGMAPGMGSGGNPGMGPGMEGAQGMPDEETRRKMRSQMEQNSGRPGGMGR